MIRIVKTCKNCETQSKCTLLLTIGASLGEYFFCSSWRCMAILTDPGQRLAEYNRDEPIITAPFKNLRFLFNEIPKELTNTKVDVLFILNDNVALIYLPTLDAHCFINTQGIKLDL
jgi:hypothetical protein